MGGSNVTVRLGASADPVFVLCAGRSGSTPAAIKGIRRTSDEMLGSYLARRGKRRYCDKSLGTARYAGLLRRVYPEAKFLCLYRHPMDVIASGLVACPWGLAGYGFDAYIASTPGNMVLALARFWADNVAGIRVVEEQFPDACHRVRYEDLVADPQQVADGIFAFLGVAPVPGIAARCFSAERERFGPADHKIWHTSRVTTGSVGREWEIPAAMIPPPVLEQISGLTDNLGYLRVDDTWGTASPPADLLEPFEQPAAGGTCSAGATRVRVLIVDRLRTGLGRLDDGFSDRWGRCSVALRRCELRYCDAGDAGPVAAGGRIGMLADLLGLTSWPAHASESRLTDAAVLS